MKKIKAFFFNSLYSIKVTYKASRQYFTLKLIFTITLSFFPFVNLYIWKNIINFLTNIKNYDGINYLIMNIVVYMLFYVITEFFQRITGYIEYKYNDKVNIYIENLMLDKFAEVDLAFYDSSKFNDKVSRIWEIKYSMTNLASQFFNTIQSLITFSTALILLAALNAIYVLLILVLSVPIFVLKIKVNRMNSIFEENNVNIDRRIGYFKNLFTNINNSFDIRLFNIKDFFISKFVKSWIEWYKRRKELTLKASIFTLISLLISTFINHILLYVLIIDKLSKKIIQIGDATYYISVFNQFYNSTMRLIGTLSWTQYAYQQVVTVKEFIELNPIIPKSGTLEPKDFSKIEFLHVYFKYPGKENYILEDCTFAIKRGQTIGLVGENGSGKSTIVKLLLRLYDIDGGQILLDGIDIKEYDIVKYRAMFGVLFQDFISYSFTLRQNIALSDYESIKEDERINDAIMKSELHDIVKSWEKGLETHLTRDFEPDGKELSGGQWQRVALARVFFSDRNFIILDEPSASLDVFAEDKIFRQFEQLSDNRSSLIISHRLSSIVNADSIIVLKEGRIIEYGTHRDLLDANGYYADLFHLQASRYITDEQKSK